MCMKTIIFIVLKTSKSSPKKKIIIEIINTIKFLFLFSEYKKLSDLKHKYLYKNFFIFLDLLFND